MSSDCSRSRRSSESSEDCEVRRCGNNFGVIDKKISFRFCQLCIDCVGKGLESLYYLLWKKNLNQKMNGLLSKFVFFYWKWAGDVRHFNFEGFRG